MKGWSVLLGQSSAARLNAAPTRETFCTCMLHNNNNRNRRKHFILWFTSYSHFHSRCASGGGAEPDLWSSFSATCEALLNNKKNNPIGNYSTALLNRFSAHMFVCSTYFTLKFRPSWCTEGESSDFSSSAIMNLYLWFWVKCPNDTSGWNITTLVILRKGTQWFLALPCVSRCSVRSLMSAEEAVWRLISEVKKASLTMTKICGCGLERRDYVATLAAVSITQHIKLWQERRMCRIKRRFWCVFRSLIVTGLK